MGGLNDLGGTHWPTRPACREVQTESGVRAAGERAERVVGRERPLNGVRPAPTASAATAARRFKWPPRDWLDRHRRHSER